MPRGALTNRSQFLTQLLPIIRKGIRAAHLRRDVADEALQQTLVGLLPRLGQLSEMPEEERFAYVYRVASYTAMALRKRIGLKQAEASREEVAAWDRGLRERSANPEELLRAAQGAEKLERAMDALDSIDQRLVEAINMDGLSERDAAREIGIPRGTAVYRLRRTRDALIRAITTTSAKIRKRKD